MTVALMVGKKEKKLVKKMENWKAGQMAVMMDFLTEVMLDTMWDD
jgi:hypothetical protein